MILRGLTVTGPRAHEIGIVHDVVGDPLTRALEIGAELSSRGAEGLAAAKRLTRGAFDRPLAEGLADKRKSFTAVMRTASAREGSQTGRPPAEIQKSSKVRQPKAGGLGIRANFHGPRDTENP